MPSLNFKKEFVPLIESGQKRQTIRLAGKRPIKAGDRLYLFTGLRTKSCKRIYFKHEYNGNLVWTNEFQICKSVEMIQIEEASEYLLVQINKRVLETRESYDFVRADGFTSNYNFINFFKKQYGLPFEGVLIKW